MRRRAAFFLLLTLTASAASSQLAGYRVGRDDVLGITVYSHPDLSGEFTVQADGSIVYPLLGQVSVAGQTVTEVKRRVTQGLEKDFLWKAVVSVTVQEFRSQKVKIFGDVKKPDLYYLDSPLRLLDLLAMAEGIPSHLGGIGSFPRARIIRQPQHLQTEGGAGPGTGGHIETLYVDLGKLLVDGDPESNIALQDGDLVYIPPIEQLVHVIGEVLSPTSIPYEDGMTVLKAITLAGGATRKASTKNIVALRVVDGKVIKIRLELGDPLQPDDVIEVPVSFW